MPHPLETAPHPFAKLSKPHVPKLQIQSFNGVLFAGIFFTCAIQAVMTVPVIGDSKPVYYREIAANMYHPWPYLFGLSVAEVPWLIAVTFMHGLIFYPIANLDSNAETIVQVIA